MAAGQIGGLGSHSEASVLISPLRSKPLLLLCSLEMWERFSYYSLYGLLVLFLTDGVGDGGLGWSNTQALQLLAVWASLAFTMPLVGGWLADRFTGPHRAVIAGSLLMIAGHCALFLGVVGPALYEALMGQPVVATIRAADVPLSRLWLTSGEIGRIIAAAPDSSAAEAALNGYYGGAAALHLGLLCLILANGFLKASIAMLVGRLFPPSDPRQESAFTLYWTGINVGSLLATLIAGAVGEKLGWHYAFLLAAVGMTAGLANYWSRSARLLGSMRDRQSSPSASKIEHQARMPRTSLQLISIIALFATLYNVAFFQLFGTINLYAQQFTDRTVFSVEVPTSWITSIDPLIILLFAPLASILWTRLAASNRNPSPAMKFAIAFGLISLAFVILASAAYAQETSGIKTALWVIALAVLLMAFSEIPLQPIGLSLVSRLSPPQLAGRILGAWVITFAVANFFAARIGVAAETLGAPLTFLLTALGCAACSAVLILLRAPMYDWLQQALKAEAAPAGDNKSG